MIDAHIWWYLARASGLIAWAVLAVSVLLGLVVAGRLTHKVPPPAWNLDLHRFLGGLGVIFMATHVLALVADSYVHFGWAEIFVPMASAWKPGAVTWGVAALYLLLAVEATSLLKRRLPLRLWRAVHLCSAPLFAVVTVHGIVAGTDATTTIAIALGSAVLVLNAGVLALRLRGPKRHRRARALPASLPDRCSLGRRLRP